MKGVLCTLRILQQRGYSITEEAIDVGLSSVVSLTGLKGRWQILQRHPLVICDTAHNLNGLNRAVNQFKKIPAISHRFILGFVADKDVRRILSVFPSEAIYYFCQPSVQRAMTVEELMMVAEKAGLKGQMIKNVNDALSQAINDATPEDAIFVGGSTFVVADLEQI